MMNVMMMLLCLNLGAGVYNPQADAKQDIAQAVAKAKQDGKHVLIQVGGNWCPWCLKMEKLMHTDADLKQAVDSNYIYIFVNYSKENKNLAVLKELGFPQRFGFPVLVVLDGDGNRLNTQNTVFLEKEKGYDKEKVISFLKNWSPAALDPATYQ